MKFVLPYPPSANRYWRVFRGHAVMSALARDYKAVVKTLYHSEPYPGLVALEMHLYRPAKRGDLDNSLKIAIDALKGIAFVDDKQVKRIEAEQFDDKYRPRLEIIVRPYP